MFSLRVMIAALCCIGLLFVPDKSRAQVVPTVPVVGVGQFIEAADGFHREVIKAAVKKTREGEMRRVDLIKLRGAMISPSFRQQAEDLAVIQLSADGSDDFPIGDDGRIDRASINWEGLAAFLERLLPLLLQLIDALSQNDIDRAMEIQLQIDSLILEYSWV